MKCLDIISRSKMLIEIYRSITFLNIIIAPGPFYERFIAELLHDSPAPETEVLIMLKISHSHKLAVAKE